MRKDKLIEMIREAVEIEKEFIMISITMSSYWDE